MVNFFRKIRKKMASNSRQAKQAAQEQAHAFAQGPDIHLAQRQEKYLPHEAWHVVQQNQERVKPTMQMKGKVNVNDDLGLEKEADLMGAKVLQVSKGIMTIVSTNSIPKTLGLEPKTKTFLNTIVGTYKITDSTLAVWSKEIKISNEGKEFHLIDEENDGDFKLEHHKESIFVLMGTSTYLKFNTPNDGELFVTRPLLGNTTYSKEE